MEDIAELLATSKAAHYRAVQERRAKNYVSSALSEGQAAMTRLQAHSIDATHSHPAWKLEMAKGRSHDQMHAELLAFYGR